jgi:class 3 adenylate cyclase/streptogramin lyase
MPRTHERRGLRAVVFLDTVGSTRIAAELGDERWQRLLMKELSILRDILKGRGGREVDVAGDGLFALFDEPAEAVRFAADSAVAVRDIGLEIRAGVHFGQVEVTDGRPAGIVVHTGARVMSTGDAGHVIATSTVVDLMPGGAFGFADQGSHELKGVPGTWRLLRLVDVDAAPVAPPIPAEEAAARRREASAALPVVRRRTFLVGVAGALAGGSAITLLVTRRHPLAMPSPLRNRLFRFDPTTGVFTPMPVTLRTPTVVQLPSLAVGEGAVWVGDEELIQVDPRDGTLEGTVTTADGPLKPVALSIGLDDLWVVEQSLWRIDPADREILDVRPLDGVASGLLIAFGLAWVTFEDGSVLRIEPIEGLPIKTRTEVGTIPSDIVEAAGAVWISDEFGDLWEVDPQTGRPNAHIRLGGAPTAIAAAQDHLWIIDRDGLVEIVDPLTKNIRKGIPIGGEPVDVAAGAGAVWVADRDGRLVRIDPVTEEVDGVFEIDGRPSSVAVDDGEGVVWVRTAATKDTA